MSEKLQQWEKALKEKTEQRAQYENALNQLTAEILQIQGGIQFAKESVEPSTENTEVVEGEAPQP